MQKNIVPAGLTLVIIRDDLIYEPFTNIRSLVDKRMKEAIL